MAGAAVAGLRVAALLPAVQEKRQMQAYEGEGANKMKKNKVFNYGEALADLMQIHSHISNDVWPNGGILECVKCKHTQPFTTKQGAEYLRNGWPRHCGKEMAVMEQGDLT